MDLNCPGADPAGIGIGHCPHLFYSFTDAALDTRMFITWWDLITTCLGLMVKVLEY